jgi:hypothetical protein
MTTRRLEDIDLENIEAGAMGKLRDIEGPFVHPADTLRLVEEVRAQRQMVREGGDEIVRLQGIIDRLGARVAQQSELLARRAEGKGGRDS